LINAILTFIFPAATVNKCVFMPVIIFMAIFVIFPCSIKATEFRGINERLEHDFSFFVGSKDFGSYYFRDSSPFLFDVFQQIKVDVNESSPKNRRRFVELGNFNIFFDPINGKLIFNNNTAKVPGCAASGEAENPSQIFSEISHHPFIMFGLGFSVAGWLAIAVLDIYPRLLAKKNGLYYGFAKR